MNAVWCAKFLLFIFVCLVNVFFFVSVCESGWLDYLPRGAPRGAWTKRFFVFDNDGIRHAEDRNGHFVVISMKDVVSFRSVLFC